ncbi:hypothetical protein BDN72DRAFT_833522 [Pluteus cervinus]|uniref:Uncharacterized protein n=1 Tax=Pluteus cervinus TaxID=181527 RepID=A0ACD3B969_9AGAR|nr:hypothetical protein BDN72DRAFT_833522 [Pluteus cervinus]
MHEPHRSSGGSDKPNFSLFRNKAFMRGIYEIFLPALEDPNVGVEWYKVERLVAGNNAPKMRMDAGSSAVDHVGPRPKSINNGDRLASAVMTITTKAQPYSGSMKSLPSSKPPSAVKASSSRSRHLSQNLGASGSKFNSNDIKVKRAVQERSWKEFGTRLSGLYADRTLSSSGSHFPPNLNVSTSKSNSNEIKHTKTIQESSWKEFETRLNGIPADELDAGAEYNSDRMDILGDRPAVVFNIYSRRSKPTKTTLSRKSDVIDLSEEEPKSKRPRQGT